MADGKHYFGTDGFPVTVRRVCTTPQKTPSHPHDLTEVKHRHDFCELVIVVQGNAMHQLEETSFPVGAGDVFLLHGQQSHYFHDRQNLELINIMYDPTRIGLPENELRKMSGYCALFMLEPSYRRRHRFASRLHLTRIPLAHVEQIVDEMTAECDGKSAGYEVALRAKLLELIVYLSRAYNETSTTESRALLRVGHVIGVLENEFSREWKLDDLLKIAHMSRSNLMRVFRKATGQTPVDYLIRLRIQKAAALLRTTDGPVTEIALGCGFSDSNYFTRQFNKLMGESPTAYKKRNPLR
jgi:AraC-like DNA-binding protein/mannose-6-phosphate isomerase-like protein (cupin superfamily)